MSNIYLVAELMDDWLREENYALTNKVQLYEETIRTYRIANTLLTTRIQEMAETLHDQERITETHVDLNFRMQERIDYLELLLLRTPRPMTESDMDFSSSDDE
jgi:hypothetical protein